MPHVFLYTPGAGDCSAPSQERECPLFLAARMSLAARIHVGGVSSGEDGRASQEDRQAWLLSRKDGRVISLPSLCPLNRSFAPIQKHIDAHTNTIKR